MDVGLGCMHICTSSVQDGAKAMQAVKRVINSKLIAGWT